ncbi:Zinc-ribbon domain-containing protein [Candidatus Bealeia paramacronuclearis]|uniref:Zinc-ribbon domain-containing protein n=1 Tax=Candidatus Bealeia paramacronuclearis TaxID=1921001 RepID=A0ABZ2C4U9_9PROT|nr:Zinc-ribbon domain-containing protein [Candidatus Bealeia paramacronuclearis]
MIVRCPECSKRYAIDDKALLPSGRSVKCASCAHVWHQAPDVTYEIAENPAIQNLRDVTLPPQLHKGHWPAWVGWAFFGSIVVVFLTTFIFTRNAIVSFWPQSEALYAMVGLPVELPGMGLTLANTSTEEKEENGVAMYIVQGEIMNTSDRVKDLPVLKVSLVGTSEKGKCLQVIAKDKCLLDKWEHHLAKSHLLPGEQVHFETSPRPRIQSANSVIVAF